MTKQTLPLFLAPVALLAALPAHAQFGGPKVATISAAAKPATVTRGGKGTLLVTVNVGPQYHINAHEPGNSMYIATVFTHGPSGSIKFGTPKYPAPKRLKLSYADKPLLVYTGEIVIAVPYFVEKTARPGKTALGGRLEFQGCDAKSCYPPASASVQTMVTVK